MDPAATPLIGAAAVAAIYYYLKGRAGSTQEAALTQGGQVTPEVWRNVEHAPNTWSETLHFFKEVCR